MANRLKLLAESRQFNLFIICLILLTSVLNGLDTYPAISRACGWLFNLIDNVIIGCFVVEILIRIGAEGRRPWRYFRDPWNVFDFIIVGLCLMPWHDQPVAILRMVRVLRVMRLFKALPHLRMIVQGLVSSLKSIGYIALLLSVLFYLFAVLGVSFFGEIDDGHFGNLQTALLTLFQVVTLESWSSIMQPLRQQYPILAPAFFIIFIVAGTMVILNLFVGVIVGGMTEAHEEIRKECEATRRAKLRKSDDQPSPAERIRDIEKDMDELKEKLGKLRESIRE